MIEIGAGTAIPTIRNMLEVNYEDYQNSTYIRINPDAEDNSSKDHKRFVHLQMGCLKALTGIMEHF